MRKPLSEETLANIRKANKRRALRNRITRRFEAARYLLAIEDFSDETYQAVEKDIEHIYSMLADESARHRAVREGLHEDS